MHQLSLFTLAAAVTLGTLQGAGTQSPNTHGHRTKRFYSFINPDAPILLGFILNMPISMALPTLVDTSGRSFVEGSGHLRRPEEEYPDDLEWEPSYEQELGTLQVYFSYLKVSTVACQERLVCELAGAPDTYSPLSTLLLKELRQTHGPVKPSDKSLFWRFMAASATGYAYSEDECSSYYSKCGLPASKMLNMPVLKLWQYIAPKFNLKLM